MNRGALERRTRVGVQELTDIREISMKTLPLIIAASLVASAAFAQSSTTVIHRDNGVGESTTVKEKSVDGDTVTRRVETTGSTGCDTKSVKKTDEDGNSVSKTKTEC